MKENVIEALLQRNSCPKLEAPAPSETELERIISAALRAPDHALLRPWRFVIIQAQGLDKLAGALLAAKQAEAKASGDSLTTDEVQKLLQKPHRAPLIIAPVLHYQSHPKVPEVEQTLSLGAACQNILLAAETLGFAAMWRTGSLAFSAEVHQALALADNEKLMGFIYLGTPAVGAKRKSIPQHEAGDYMRFL